ncbi:hypothetical protein LJR225_000601 [Phenylobacterium sp. LjRoot225]|uniref:hypothetical protein n=1 Tax=Phenylobacterium sp. LjRoot225 TaxID=3342285 RepID=UPI003ECD8206
MTTLESPRPLYGPVDERAVIPPPHPLPVQARSHRYGEGQTQRTVTQDEQDRLASNRQPPRAIPRQLNPA